MELTRNLLTLLDEVLHLEGRALSFTPQTPLLGAVPELDSMAVIELLTALQQRFGIEWHDDELSGSVFDTVGSLVAFVQARTRGSLPVA